MSCRSRLIRSRSATTASALARFSARVNRAEIRPDSIPPPRARPETVAIRAITLAAPSPETAPKTTSNAPQTRTATRACRHGISVTISRATKTP